MKRKLSHIIIPWQRFLVTTLINSLLLVDKLTSSRPRARAHWVGHHRRPVRPERLLILFLFVTAIILLEPREFATWAAIWGGITAIIVILVTIHAFIPRKRTRWVN